MNGYVRERRYLAAVPFLMTGFFAAMFVLLVVRVLLPLVHAIP